MRRSALLAALLAGVVSNVASAQQTATMPIIYRGEKTAPVPQDVAVPEDSAEEIAKDSARDLKDSRFYNKPGATRAQYDADWQTCRLIARGSRTPSGSIPYFYNPAVVSPLAAGIGGGIGGLIGAAIAQGQQRRDNRRTCLMIKGWRLVELPDAEAAKVTAMTDDARSAYFDGIVGAADVKGKVTERTSFALAPDRALKLDAPIAGPGTLWLGKKVDPAAPMTLAPDEAAVVIAWRRPDAASAGRSGMVQLWRYDMGARDLLYRPKNWKKTGDKTTYSPLVDSKDRKAPYEVQVLKVTPGDYVIAGNAVGPAVITNSYCFGAPAFSVAAGEVAYVGDFVPYIGAELSTGEKLTALAYTSHIEDTRAVLAAKQPALATSLKPAALRNGATYGCSAITMDRWDAPGAEMLPKVMASK